MATFISKHLIQNEIAIDKDSAGGLVITTNMQQQLHYFPPTLRHPNNDQNMSQGYKQAQSLESENNEYGQKPVSILQMRQEFDSTEPLKQRPKTKSKSMLVPQVSIQQKTTGNMSTPLRQFKARSSVNSGTLDSIDFKEANNSQFTVQMNIDNNHAQTIDWTESTPVQKRRGIDRNQIGNSEYENTEDYRIRQVRTAAPKQRATLTYYEEIQGPVIIMPSRQTHSIAYQPQKPGRLKKDLSSTSSKPFYPQTQKNQRRKLISNGIFLPSESVGIFRENTVTSAAGSQRPVLQHHQDTLTNSIPTGPSKQQARQAGQQQQVAVGLPVFGGVEISQLDQNLSFAYEINHRPTTTSVSQKGRVQLKQELHPVGQRFQNIKEHALNQQFLVSDQVMKQRLALSNGAKKLDTENKGRDQINQKIMDNSFGRIDESQSPEPREPPVGNQDQLMTENQPSSLLAASLYERTNFNVIQTQKAQLNMLKRPKVQEGSFDPSFIAYQNGATKGKSATQSLTEKAKLMEQDVYKSIYNQQSESQPKKKITQFDGKQAEEQFQVSRKASFGFDEESKAANEDLVMQQEPEQNQHEILFYGQKKSNYTFNVLKTLTTQKPGQSTIQPTGNFQRVKATSSRTGTSSQKYAITDIQQPKSTGVTCSEALNQQLQQQQAYFQQQRALINQITHQNSKVLKEKAQEESLKAKPYNQTVRTKSSGSRKQVFSMTETQAKFNPTPLQVQEGQTNKFMSNRQTSFAKTSKQEVQKIKNKGNLHVETKGDRHQQNDLQCLTADSVLPKRSLIEVIPIIPSQTHQRGSVIPERNQSKIQIQKDAVQPEPSQKAQEQTKVKEYIYSDPGVNIGKGKYGPVDLIIVGGKLMALKRIRKDSISNQKRIDHVKAEKKVLNFLHQENDKGVDFIVKLYDTFTDSDHICFVFEYLAGQDLFWVLQNEHNLALGKQEAGGRRVWVTFYCAEILVALNTLHSSNIIYRDLKPDNIMIDNQGHIKLIDFGFSKSLGQGNDARTQTNCGTLGYTAPEVIAGQGYSYSADLWSFGIVIVELLSGSLPFEEKNDPMLIQQAILQGDVKYQREGVDNTARDLLSQIFVVEPNLRTTMERIKQHRFFVSQQMQTEQNITAQTYWKQIQQKKYNNGQVPYKPNPMKYQYLLQNTYERISNLQGTLALTNQQLSQEEESSPYPRGANRGNSPTKKNTNMLGNFTVHRVNKEFENF